MRPLPAVVFLAAVIAVVLVLVLTGSADHKAKPGARGRVQVAPARTHSP